MPIQLWSCVWYFICNWRIENLFSFSYSYPANFWQPRHKFFVLFSSSKSNWLRKRPWFICYLRERLNFWLWGLMDRNLNWVYRVINSMRAPQILMCVKFNSSRSPRFIPNFSLSKVCYLFRRQSHDLRNAFEVLHNTSKINHSSFLWRVAIIERWAWPLAANRSLKRFCVKGPLLITGIHVSEGKMTNFESGSENINPNHRELSFKSICGQSDIAMKKLMKIAYFPTISWNTHSILALRKYRQHSTDWIAI